MTAYPSKRDTWLVLLLWTGVVGMLWGALVTWETTASPWVRVTTSIALLLGAGFVIWVLYGTCYTLSQEALTIRSGPFRWNVALDTIREVFPTRNPLSSPACSLDRLHIRYTGSRFGVMISPRDKDAFLRDMAARSPHLERRDDRLVRREA